MGESLVFRNHSWIGFLFLVALIFLVAAMWEPSTGTLSSVLEVEAVPSIMCLLQSLCR